MPQRKTLYKRYQAFGRDGIIWTDWFHPIYDNKEPIQNKTGKITLKNEYKEVFIN
jgi:hypothetical protein